VPRLLSLGEVGADGLSLAQGGDDVRDSTGVEIQPLLYDLVAGGVDGPDRAGGGYDVH